jgi:hypothetical protein
MEDLHRGINELAASDWMIRQHGCVLLGDVGDANTVGLLIETLRDQHKEVRRCAAEALGKIGDPQSVAPLINALRDSDEYVRQCVAAALGDIGDARAVDPLLEALNLQDKWVRYYVAEALGKICDACAIDALIETLRDQSAIVRKKAQESLEKLRQHLGSITGEEAANLICPVCLCRFEKHQAKLGFLKDFTYYACRNCHGSQCIDNVAKVIVVLDTSITASYAHSNTNLLVNWFKYKDPFDFDEVQIIAAEDFDVEEFVVKMRNDVDKMRRKRYSSISLHLSSDVKLTQSKINLLKSTFSIGANDNAK